MRALPAVLNDDAYERGIHDLGLGETTCSPRTSKDNETKHSDQFEHLVEFVDYI